MSWFFDKSLVTACGNESQTSSMQSELLTQGECDGSSSGDIAGVGQISSRLNIILLIKLRY